MMHRSIDEICEELDELSLKSLELMEEKVSVTLQIENLLRDGHIELAKARYIRGMETIGILQVPTEAELVESLFEIHRTERADNIPKFDIINKMKKIESHDIQDPLKWFGVLVPQNLRNAQKRFQAVLQLSARCANVRSEIILNTEKLEDLKRTKLKIGAKEE
ncbi:coiled-coil domain-containing protein 115 [Athalia rosae]|uniref:coiled-coil domain-containing protein 115 n=1 Tax=Athalia rosae TaxID=37344 RepID=UPI000625D686|nr:coiled-coil domain-containing protein 115 [Athalia rosae]